MATSFATTDQQPSTWAPALVLGFASAIGLWSVWFVAHLPWLGISENAGLVALGATWLLALGISGACVGSRQGWKVGLGAGLTSAILGLLLLGATRHPHPGATGEPSLGAAVVGFLAAGAVLGLAGGALGGAIGGTRTRAGWLHRFAFVAVAAAAPLIIVGGLVTSTNSGMAVPDWPGTYGHNMFLFPLAGPAPEANKPYESVYLEHSHRLFGTLVGAATLVLMIWILTAERRRWLKIWGVSIFAIVVLQGLLGAFRVLKDSPATGVIHGILAQVTLAGLVALAVLLWATPERAGQSLPFSNPRRVRAFATAALHTVLLQLVFGALYRHLRDTHALWTHVGFSFIVLTVGVLGGFWASAVPRESGPLARALRACGWAVVAVVFLQFLLGWAALGMGGREREAPSIAAALVRTAHQANGALLLGFTTAAAVLAKVLYRNVAAAGQAQPA